jgi:hypothetical protein
MNAPPRAGPDTEAAGATRRIGCRNEMVGYGTEITQLRTVRAR